MTFEYINLLPTLVGLIAGAVLGVVADRLYDALRKRARRKNPLEISARRSHVPPLWYATDLPLPARGSQDAWFDAHIQETAPFCGFAKINIEAANTSEDVVYITDIRIRKEASDARYPTRVRYIPQGACSAIRLFALMDDDDPKLVEDIARRHGIAGGFFERGDRVKVAPGETERIYIVLLAATRAWRFDIDVAYAVAGEERCAARILGSDNVIVPFVPEQFEDDYCSFLEAVDPGYDKFDDSGFFTDEMRKADPSHRRTEPDSAIGYLQRLAGQ